MPSLSSGFKLIDANSSAVDAVSAGNLPFQGTATDVLSQPMTTTASVCSSMVSLVSNVMTTSNTSAAISMQTPGSISSQGNVNAQFNNPSSNASSGSDVNLTSSLQGPKLATTFPQTTTQSLLSSALSAQSSIKSSAQLMMNQSQENVSSTSGAILTQAETQNQNALLKQLLSSTPTQKSNTDTSPVKTSFSLEAQLDQPTDNETYKSLPKQTLSSLATKIPNPQTHVGPQGQGIAQTKVTTPTPNQMQPQNIMAPPPSNPNVAGLQNQSPSNPQQSPLLAQQLSSGGSTPTQSSTPSTTMSPMKTDSTASMSEGLAGHLSAVAKLPTQPVPPNSLAQAGVVQVQPNSASTVITPQPLRPQGQPQGMRPPVPGGIQNLLQSQVPIPPNQLQMQQQRALLQQQQQQQRVMQQQQLQQQQLQQQQQQQQTPTTPISSGAMPISPQIQQQRAMLQQQQLQQQQMQHKQEQQQQLQQQRLQHEQLRQQQMQHMQQQQQLRMQQQQQQQASNNFEPPQQIVGMQNRLPGPAPFPQQGQMMSQAGPRPMGAMQQMMNQVSQANIRQQMGIGARMSSIP